MKDRLKECLRFPAFLIYAIIATCYWIIFPIGIIVYVLFDWEPYQHFNDIDSWLA